MSRGCQTAWLLLLLMLAPATPHAQPAVRPIEDYLTAEEIPRYALAIGVEHYDYLERVPNALNDLDAAVEAFRRAGFSTILQLHDASLDAIRTSVKQLVQLVEGTERPAVVVIFFAGHGFQDREANFIVPRDAAPDDLQNGSVSVANIVVRLAPRRAGMNILFLDACRTAGAIFVRMSAAVIFSTGSWSPEPRIESFAVARACSRAAARARRIVSSLSSHQTSHAW